MGVNEHKKCWRNAAEREKGRFNGQLARATPLTAPSFSGTIKSSLVMCIINKVLAAINRRVSTDNNANNQSNRK